MDVSGANCQDAAYVINMFLSLCVIEAFIDDSFGHKLQRVGALKNKIFTKLALLIRKGMSKNIRVCKKRLCLEDVFLVRFRKQSI